MKKSRFSAVNIAECAIFVVLMVAGTYISIPFPLVPLTFQTAVSVLAGLLLGTRKGMVSMAVYCFMGLVGLPVFSAGGGIAYIFKPSFGYIIGFVASAGVAGIACGKNYPFWKCALIAVSACFADYIIGIPYCIICAKLLGVENLTSLFLTGNLIYLPKDILLSILGALVAKTVAPAIHRRSSGTLKDKTHNDI